MSPPWPIRLALVRELAAAAGMTLKNPAGVIAANARLAWGSAGAFRAAAERAIGRDNRGPIAIARGDKRFSDPAFQENPAYFLLAQQYLLFGQLVAELLDTAGVSGAQKAKARFAANFLSMRSPRQTLWSATPRQFARLSTPAARASAEASRTWCTIFATTVDGRRRSTAPDSRSASTWLPHREASSTAATSSS